MKRITTVTVLAVLTVATAFSQSSALDPETMETIRSALRDIAIKDNTIENIIYDGMTLSDVEQILGETVAVLRSYTIETDWALNDFTYVSIHGSYALFWSSNVRWQSPVVIGYAHMRDREVRHNYLE